MKLSKGPLVQHILKFEGSIAKIFNSVTDLPITKSLMDDSAKKHFSLKIRSKK